MTPDTEHNTETEKPSSSTRWFPLVAKVVLAMVFLVLTAGGGWALWKVATWLGTADSSVSGPVLAVLLSLAGVYFAARREHRLKLRREAVLKLSDIHAQVIAASGGTSPKKVIQPFGITHLDYHKAQLLGALFFAAVCVADPH